MTGMEYGPYREDMYLSSGLDYYKPTMSQLLYEQQRDTEVTFTFKNRGGQRIEEYVEPEALQQRLDTIRERGWQDEEIDYFATLRDSDGERIFSDDFLNYIQAEPLPLVQV